MSAHVQMLLIEDDPEVERNRRSAQRQAALYRRLLTSIVENSNDGIVACNSQGRILSWNRSAEAIVGYSESEALGRSIDSIVPASKSQLAERHIRMASVLGGEAQQGLYERSHKDGTPLVLSVNAFRLPNFGGMPGGGVGVVFRDVTDLIANTNTLARQNEELRARDRQMRALAARLEAIREEEGKRIAREVHDELGQLLSSMKWDLQRVERRLDDPALIERLRDCGALADRTILAVQRIATALRPSVFDDFGLTAAIRDEARRFQARTAIQVSVEADDGENVSPEPALAFFRILQEILTNVARHACASLITVRLYKRVVAGGDAEWTLDVRDNGSGFVEDPGALSTSLGLLGMRERAELLGGSVCIETAPGQGTRVIVQITDNKGAHGR
jgi:two-component system sensor histidine kinase UhpB